MRPARRNRYAAVVLATALAAATVPAAGAQEQPAADPLWTQLVPAPQRIGGAGASWSPSAATRVIVDRKAHRKLTDEAELLAAELADTGHTPGRPEVRTGSPEDVRYGDVWLSLGHTGSGSPERYALDVGRSARIVAPTDTGVFHGTRTLLQAAARAGAGNPVPGARIDDWPMRGNRTVMVDNGRKYFSPGWLRDLIRSMAWQKNNTLELHFSENEGFRIASDRHPEVVSADGGVLSKQEVRELIEFGKRYHVDVVPALDSPGHFRQILNAHPELRMTLSDGTVQDTDLDYSKPEARALVADLIAEYTELFDSEYFHIGGDEFASLKDPAKAPQLTDYARTEVGPAADIHDGYTRFQNELVDLLAAKGKTAISYNNSWDNGRQLEPLDRRVIVDFWARHTEAWATVYQWLDAGYQVRNMDENLLYYVIAPQFQDQPTGKTRTPGWLYERWRPERYLSLSFTQELEYHQVPRDAPGQFGSVLAIWSDKPDFQTEEQVRERFVPWLAGFSARGWGSAVPTESYQEFLEIYRPLATAPPAPG